MLKNKFKYVISSAIIILLALPPHTALGVPVTPPAKSYGTLNITLTDEYGRYAVDRKGNVWNLIKKHPNETWELIINPEFEECKDETFVKGNATQVFTADFIKYVQTAKQLAEEALRIARDAKGEADAAYNHSVEAHIHARETRAESQAINEMLRDAKKQKKYARLQKMFAITHHNIVN